MTPDQKVLAAIAQPATLTDITVETGYPVPTILAAFTRLRAQGHGIIARHTPGGETVFVDWGVIANTYTGDSDVE